MSLSFKLTSLAIASALSYSTACANTPIKTIGDSTQLKFTVEEAPEWSALFNRSSGWFGGDGIFTFPLNGAENKYANSNTQTMFVFSDTIWGEVENGQIKPPGFTMVHNSVAYLKGNKPAKENIKFEIAKDAKGKPDHLFVPKVTSAPDIQPNDYYWLGDGFVNKSLNNTTYVFAWHMRNLDKNDDWSFTSLSTNIIAIPVGSKPPFKNQRQIKTPFKSKGHSYGIGIFVNTKTAGASKPDEYIYIYGARDGKLVVARVLEKDFEKLQTWRFWDGSKWNTDMEKAMPLADNISHELSVTELPDGRYALVYQHGSIGSTIALRVGATPYGTFGPKIDVYTCQEDKQKNIFTYNAKVHPHLSAPGELLISYNVNAFDFGNEIKKSPNLYRPRFIKLKIQK